MNNFFALRYETDEIISFIQDIATTIHHYFGMKLITLKNKRHNYIKWDDKNYTYSFDTHLATENLLLNLFTNVTKYISCHK